MLLVFDYTMETVIHTTEKSELELRESKGDVIVLGCIEISELTSKFSYYIRKTVMLFGL